MTTPSSSLLSITDITLVQTVPNMLSHIQSLTWTMDEPLASSEDGIFLNQSIDEISKYRIPTAGLSSQNKIYVLRWLNKIDDFYTRTEGFVTEDNKQSISNIFTNTLDLLQKINIQDKTQMSTQSLVSPHLSATVQGPLLLEFDEVMERIATIPVGIQYFEAQISTIVSPTRKTQAEGVLATLQDLKITLEKIYCKKLDEEARVHDIKLFEKFSTALYLTSEELLDLSDATFFDTSERLNILETQARLCSDALGFLVRRATYSTPSVGNESQGNLI